MRLTRHLSILSLVAPLAIAGAQERTYTITGQGTLDFGRGSRRVERVDMTLRDNGAFSALVMSQGQRYAFGGSWSRRGQPGAEERIRIDNALGDSRSNGSGTLTYRANRSPRSIDLSGDSRDGRYRLYLEGDVGGVYTGNYPTPYPQPYPNGRDDGGYNNGRSINASTSGRGSVRFGNNDRRISDASVEFGRNGQASLHVGGNANFDASGRWEQVDGDTYRIRVNRVNGDNANGTITVNLRDYGNGNNRSNGRYDRGRGNGGLNNGRGGNNDGVEIASIDGEGRYGRDRYSVSFAGR